MKILITGSNGIIGCQILRKLLETFLTAEIVVINRKPSSVILERVISLEVDLLEVGKTQVEAIFNKIRPELFFHLAWDTGHSNYLNTVDNLRWEEVSIMLINGFYNSGGKRFVGIGSSLEYDWSFVNPFDEKTSPTGSKWLYGRSKLNVYNHLAALSNISFLWCRVFFVFGPGQDKSRLIPLIINNALNASSPLTINLTLKRDYISTYEIANQVVMMLKSNYSGPVNICSGTPRALGDIVNAISDFTKRKVSINTLPFQDKFEIKSLGGRIELIKHYYKGYNYSSKAFNNDLKKTIEYIKSITIN